MPVTGRDLHRPAQWIVGGFTLAIAVGTLLLSLPWARRDGISAPFIDALFTATSAVCVTGLVTVDTGTYWSTFGQVVILLLIQVGGLGIMTLASLVAILLFRRVGLQSRIAAETESKSLSGAHLGSVLKRVVVFAAVVEGALAVFLSLRFITVYDMAPGEAVWSGVFHSVSSFNNAGFSIYPDNLTRFVTDSLVLLPIAGAVVIGGLGFPVVFELLRSWFRPRTWSMLTRVTVIATVILLVGGSGAFWIAENDNPATLGGVSAAQGVGLAIFTSVMPRTAGFNAFDLADLRPESVFLTDILMFIGGGSAGTAGGVKVTTLGLLAFAVLAEVRGRPDVAIGRRTVHPAAQRQALSIITLSATAIGLATFILMALSPFTFEQTLFEVISAFSTVGLSLGITADLPDTAQLILVVLMFAGRIGPLTVATALAARERRTLIRLPEERMIIG